MDGATLPRIHWKTEINLGHVLTMVPLIVGLIWFYADMLAELEQVQDARSKYVPIIEQNDKVVQLQGERIDRLATSISDLRSMTVDLTNSLRQSNETLALEHRVSSSKLSEQLNAIGISVVKLEAALQAMDERTRPSPPRSP